MNGETPQRRPRKRVPRGLPREAAVTRGQAVFDLTLALTLAASYVAAENLSLPKRWLLPAIAIAVLGFGVSLYRRGGETLADFGLSRQQLSPAAKETGLLTLFAAFLILILAASRGSRIWTPSMLILLPLYPIYGLVQQWIFQGIIHRRLRILSQQPTISILLTSLAFSLVHTGNLMLMLLTFLAGLFWSLIYARHGNLWPLGLSHGFLAALSYPLILGDNPLQRF